MKIYALTTKPAAFADFFDTLTMRMHSTHMLHTDKSQIDAHAAAGERRLTQEEQEEFSGCFNELRYDTRNNRIVAVGMGFGGPQNAIVAINLDKSPGAVTQISPAISRDCALYLQCSCYNSWIQQKHNCYQHRSSTFFDYSYFLTRYG